MLVKKYCAYTSNESQDLHVKLAVYATHRVNHPEVISICVHICINLVQTLPLVCCSTVAVSMNICTCHWEMLHEQSAHAHAIGNTEFPEAFCKHLHRIFLYIYDVCCMQNCENWHVLHKVHRVLPLAVLIFLIKCFIK